MEQNNENEELDFNNILDEFRTAVFNGQVRLALEHLVTIVDVFVEVLSSDENEIQSSESNVKTEEIQKKEDKRLESSAAEEKPAVKKTTKETVEKTEE